MLLYYITDRKQLPGGDAEQRSALLAAIVRAARAGVDFIQLREKDLRLRDLELLAREALHAVRENSATTRLLINSRTDVALALGLDGVHLTSTDLGPAEVRAIHAAANRTRAPLSPFVVAVSCHSASDVRLGESHGADFVVLAPIFEKIQARQSGIGLDALSQAARQNPPDLRVEAGDNRVGIPVLALGGVTLENAAACIVAGAAGVAGIRLFQREDVTEVVKRLKNLASLPRRSSA